MSNAIVNRWLPRLTDRSIDVQDRSIAQLGRAAVADPECREIVLPALMSLAEAPSEPWANRIPSSVLSATEDIPLDDPAWVSRFLEFYLRLAKGKRCVEEDALNLAAKVVERDCVDPISSLVQDIVSYAKARLSDDDDSDSRSSMYRIIDWYEDRTSRSE